MTEPIGNVVASPRYETGHAVKVLLQERQKLVDEIRRIDRFLEQEGVDVRKLSSGLDARLTPWGRPRNSMTKVQALELVLSQAVSPLTPRELVSQMTAAGYQFSSADPSNTLNPYLYGRSKLDTIEKFGRGFILKSRREEILAGKKPGAGAPAGG